MPVDFNGTTSKLESTTYAHGITTQVTASAWLWADGLGEGNSGAWLAIDNVAGIFFLNHGATANVLRFFATWSGVDGQWTFPALDNQWNAVSLSYDAGSLSNDPSVRVNGATVTVTQVATPTGTFTNPATGYCIGNLNNGNFTWDGMLQHVMAANALWSDREKDQALIRPGSVRRGLKIHNRILYTGDIHDASGGAAQCTATALTTRDSGPPHSPLLSGWGGYPYAVVAAGGGSSHRPSLAMLGVG